MDRRGSKGDNLSPVKRPDDNNMQAMKSCKPSIAVLFAAFLLLTCFSYAGSIHEAAAEGNVERVKELLEANPDLASVADDLGDNPLHCAAGRGQEAVIILLLSHRAEVNAKGAFDETPLHRAARQGHASAVELLLANKADVNAQGIEGKTPLQVAVFNGHESVVRLLLANQADVDAKDAQGITALHLAAHRGDLATVRLLLEHKAAVDSVDQTGTTPLSAASEAEIGRAHV